MTREVESEKKAIFFIDPDNQLQRLPWIGDLVRNSPSPMAEIPIFDRVNDLSPGAETSLFTAAQFAGNSEGR